MPTFTTANTSATAALLTTWLNKKFISDLDYQLQHSKFTTKAIIPQGAGNTGRFISWDEPGGKPTDGALGSGQSYSGAAQTALTEATTTEHEITHITTNSHEIDIAEFGEFHKTGQMAMYAAVQGARERLLKRLKDGASVAVDGFCEAKARQSTNILYCTTAVQGGVTTGPAAISAAGTTSLMHARKLLFAGLAKGFTGISGHPSGHYGAIITPKQELDITTEVSSTRVTWADVVKNVPGAEGIGKWINGYIGSVYGVAVYTTQNYSSVTYTSASEIGYVLADDGVGAMAFRDMQPRIVLNDVNSPDRKSVV